MTAKAQEKAPQKAPAKADSAEATKVKIEAAWEGFQGMLWKKEIDVRAFIQLNYTPYEGDASFLKPATDRLSALVDDADRAIAIAALKPDLIGVVGHHKRLARAPNHGAAEELRMGIPQAQIGTHDLKAGRVEA